MGKLDWLADIQGVLFDWGGTLCRNEREPDAIGRGVAAIAAEFAPTTQQTEVAAKLRADARAAKAQFDGLVTKDLAAFNAMLQQQGLAGIIAR